MKVLVADDDRAFVRLLSARLQAKGMDVTVAQDVVQATIAARRTRPDAVVLDISMPGGTGMDVLKRLRDSAQSALTPVIVVSGSSDPALPEQVMKLGADAFLPKPVDFDALLAALESAGSPPGV